MISEIIAHIRYPTAICIIVGLVSLFYFRKLNFTERFIIIVIFLNIIADLLANYFDMRRMNNGDVYNVICPVEKIILLAVYFSNAFKDNFKRFYVLGIIAIISLSIGGYVFTGPGPLHTQVYIISGFVVAILSYLQLRQIVLDKAIPSTPIFWFGLANLIYYTLMVSSMSARPVAITISRDFASQILLGNDLAYVLWSLTTLIGIIWNRTKN